jgi:hypothetical protein
MSSLDIKSLPNRPTGWFQPQVWKGGWPTLLYLGISLECTQKEECWILLSLLWKLRAILERKRERPGG